MAVSGVEVSATYDILITRALWDISEQIVWPECIKVVADHGWGQLNGLVVLTVEDSEAPEGFQDQLVEWFCIQDSRSGKPEIMSRRRIQPLSDWSVWSR